MGGAIFGGNVDAVAEYNIYVDPEAAQVVFQGGCPLTMVGLEIGRKALFRRSHMGAVIERSLISTQLMHVAMDIDAERFLDLLITRLAGQ